MRKIAIVASASGNGKTTLGRELARRLGVPFVELDALVHGPGWTETPDDALRGELEPVLAGEGWVIDGTYRHKLGDLVLARADAVVWLDLPMRVWLPRLASRTWRRYRRREELWNGNRETLRDALWGREALFAYALRSHFARRREWPEELQARFNTIRLRTSLEVERFLAGIQEATRMHFAVIREQGPGWEPEREMREQPGWAEHAAYMDQLAEEGFVLFAGPITDGSPVHRALLIVESGSEAEVAARLEADPWTPMAVLTTATVYRWTVLIGEPATMRG